MKKNKNGFTLIEMLVTITVLATLSVVVGFSITGVLNRQKERKYETYKEDLEDAACVYAQKQNIMSVDCINNSVLCQISIPTLIENGLTKSNITNPVNNKNIAEDTSYILIEYIDGERICTYKEINENE